MLLEAMASILRVVDPESYSVLFLSVLNRPEHPSTAAQTSSCLMKNGDVKATHEIEQDVLNEALEWLTV